ncbi:MAG: hypothetical protein RRY35_04190, partial [Clostridiales bacterium]
MGKLLTYEPDKRHEFSQEWLPHHKVHDCWQFQGLLHERNNIERYFFWCCSLNKFSNNNYSLFLSMTDITDGEVYGDRIVFKPGNAKNLSCAVDEESIFIGNKLQILNAPRAMALALRHEDFAASICLVKNQRQSSYGNENQLWQNGEVAGKQELATIVLPQLTSSCKLILKNRELKLAGRSVMERAFGPYSLRRALDHGERFYIFLNNGAEIMVLNFPHTNRSRGKYFPLHGESANIEEIRIKATATRLIGSWCFGSCWSITIPGVEQEEYYIIPLSDAQFVMPCSRIVAGVFSHKGEKVGYCLGELLPGA